MPWKATKDAYTIWLSEIILQQTRVEQGRPYFNKFIAAYPNVTDLANAPEDEVMRLWEGLGYYSRARNLHFTAKYIAEELNGIFPNTYETIKQLKGVGTYTAAAIASFAYDLPHAVVDGNVYRVLSRIFGIDTPIDTTKGKKEFAKLADELLAKKQAAAYNQAIMDFGATQCVPKNPNCEICPMQSECVAFRADLVSRLPVKSKKMKKKSRFFNYLFIKIEKEHSILRKRVEKDIWQNLYELPMIETSVFLSKKELEKHDFWHTFFIEKPAFLLKNISKIYKQQLTHRTIHARFFEIELLESDEIADKNAIKVSISDFSEYAFPKIVNTYLSDREAYQQNMLF